MPLRLSPEDAEAKGYHSITYKIDPHTEMWILDNVLRDLRAGNISFVIVVFEDGQLEVWRGARNYA